MVATIAAVIFLCNSKNELKLLGIVRNNYSKIVLLL